MVAVCVGVTTPGFDDVLTATTHALHAASLDAPVLVGGAGVTDADHAARLGADGWSGADAESVIAAVDAAAAMRGRGASG